MHYALVCSIEVYLTTIHHYAGKIAVSAIQIDRAVCKDTLTRIRANHNTVTGRTSTTQIDSDT
jgi:hypothetical protein